MKAENFARLAWWAQALAWALFVALVTWLALDFCGCRSLPSGLAAPAASIAPRIDAEAVNLDISTLQSAVSNVSNALDEQRRKLEESKTTTWALILSRILPSAIGLYLLALIAPCMFPSRTAWIIGLVAVALMVLPWVLPMLGR